MYIYVNVCVHPPGSPKKWSPFYILYICPLGHLEKRAGEGWWVAQKGEGWE